MKALIARGAIAGFVAVGGATSALGVGISWMSLVSGSTVGALAVAGLALTAAGMIVFTGDVSAMRAAGATLAGHLAALLVALPLGGLANRIAGTVLPGTFIYVVVAILLAALLCGGRVSIVVVSLCLAIVLVGSVVPVQGGPLGWTLWMALVIGAWTVIPIAARRPAAPPRATADQERVASQG